MEKTHLSPEPTRCEKDRVRDEIAQLPEIALTEKLDAGDLEELRRWFYPEDKDHGRLAHDLGSQKELGLGIPLSRESFADAVFNVIGNKEYEIAARKLFDKLSEEDQLSDGCIWWDDFLEVIIRGSAEAQLMGAPPSKRIKGKRNALICPCKSPVVRVLLLETPHSACYAIVSKLGNVGVYNEHFDLKVKYSVPMGKYKTSNCSWVTDAVYAVEANGVIISTSTRNLYFYNTSQIVHKLLFIILGTDNIPTCLHYCALPNREAELTIGDDKGDITSFHFYQPNKSFFQPQPEKEATSYFWMVKTQKQWVYIESKRKVHVGEVNMVEFFPENKSIVSCSNDAGASLVMRHKSGKQSSYITKVEKGVRRFHLDKRLGLLITVSGDYSIKLWNPVVTSAPIEELEGHGAPVIDIAILKHIRSVLSISEDAHFLIKKSCYCSIRDRIATSALQTSGAAAYNKIFNITEARRNYFMELFVGIGTTDGEFNVKVMKVWDLESHSCVQTLHMNFPCRGRLMDLYRNLYPGIRSVANSDEACLKEQPTVQSLWDKAADDDVIQTPFRKDTWLRSEVVVVMGKFLKVLELESLFGQNLDPLPIPRRNLEPAIPTPYYPLTHTFRENTKSLKQKMFKNLASLAPFHESTTLSSFDLKHEYEDDVKVLRMLIRNGAPHLALTLSKRKPLSRSFFKIQDS